MFEILETCMRVLFYRDVKSLDKVWGTHAARSTCPKMGRSVFFLLLVDSGGT